jgi:DNA modification methylase
VRGDGYEAAARVDRRRQVTTASGEGWLLHQGDCLAGMRELADQSVDVTITDPPFSAGLYARHRTNSKRFRGDDERNNSKIRLEAADVSIGAIDEILDDCANEIMRITRRWAVVFSDVEIAHRWREAFGNWYIRGGVWVKPDAMPQISGDRPAQGFEYATIVHRPGRKRWNGGGRPAVWTFATCRGVERPEHPCPKPLPLMRELVSLFSDPDELILDPFAGSGSTGVACRQLGRRFIGWELNQDYFDIACRRLRGDEAKPNPAQPSLFGGAA